MKMFPSKQMLSRIPGKGKGQKVQAIKQGRRRMQVFERTRYRIQGNKNPVHAFLGGPVPNKRMWVGALQSFVWGRRTGGEGEMGRGQGLDQSRVAGKQDSSKGAEMKGRTHEGRPTPETVLKGIEDGGLGTPRW